ncbi:aminopeptidase P family protein [Ginsengibacter hankyongi]|uniref:Aminopeptidase P family protein n=2 Tax=Ginsengibacter hankyongi TaxID=2607284 RepID=A0A5J5ICC1_9BACT|nr:aminopeptidase P family protein [Ginsengibacter hankyongi]
MDEIMDTKRKQMLQGIINKHHLGALIFWRPDELVMTLGYMPLWGLSFLLYTADDRPVLFIPEAEPVDIIPTGITFQTFPWGNISCPDPWENLYNQMKLLLQQKNLQELPVSFIPSIGGSAPCRMAGEQPPLPPGLIAALNGVSRKGWVDVSSDLLNLYAYKTAFDIQQLTITHQISAIAVQTFYANAVSGNTEADIAAAVEYEVAKCVNMPQIHFARAWAMIQSGVNAAWGGTYNRTTGKRLQNGELVIMEIGICVNGYWADITRTAKIGDVSKSQHEIYDLVYEAQKSGISMMKPGVKMRTIDSIVREKIEAAGFGRFFKHALGHHVGFRYHDFGPLLSPGSDSLLEEGMLLTVEPGIYGEEINMGVRIEDNVLITDSGCMVLSSYPGVPD